MNGEMAEEKPVAQAQGVKKLRDSPEVRETVIHTNSQFGPEAPQRSFGPSQGGHFGPLDIHLDKVEAVQSLAGNQVINREGLNAWRVGNGRREFDACARAIAVDKEGLIARRPNRMRRAASGQGFRAGWIQIAGHR